MSVETNRLITTMSSEEYHSTADTYSSSQLKTMLEDEELFHRKYVTKEVEREEIPAFAVGTYFHTAVLEPEKLSAECAVYKGMRRGVAWEEFKAANSNKAIITESEEKVAAELVRAVKNSPVAMAFIERGTPEVSVFVDILVDGGDIFAPEFCARLNPTFGWVRSKIPKVGLPLRLKVRADSYGQGFVLDLKSTSGNAKDVHLMKGKVSGLNYDLSAALYVDIFHLMDLTNPAPHFYWTFASKDYGNTRTYMASQKNIQVGRGKWSKAVLELARNIRGGWQFVDRLEVLEPNNYELEHIRQDKSEL